MGKTLSLLGIGLALLLAVPVAAAEGEAAALAAKLKEAKVSLQQGLSASAKNGKPISGKFEVEDGNLQLSVYTAKGDMFSEVIVDQKTGKVVKAELITSGDDFTAAKAQNEAMAKANTSLSAAVSRALKANKGYRAVSATPSMKDDHPTAEVTLLKGTESKTVSEALD